MTRARRKAALLLATTVAIVAACDSGPTTPVVLANVHLLALNAPYSRADTIIVMLHNELSVGVSYGGTGSLIYERRDAGRWHVVDGTPGPTNDLPLNGTIGVESIVIRQPVRDWTPDGEYRLKLWVGADGGSNALLVSNTFRIGTGRQLH